MTHEEINKTIHEARGLCWHEWETIRSNMFRLGCNKCGRIIERSDIAAHLPSYTSSWSGYGPMLEEMMKKEWWREFLGGFFSLPEEYLNPLTGPTALAEFIVANPQLLKGANPCR